MAGPTPGTATQFWTNLTPVAGATETYELDTGQCYAVEVIVNLDLNASATDGGTLKVFQKTGASGTKANKPMMEIALDGDPDGVSFILPPGTYSIECKNDDATYAFADLDGFKRLLT